MESAGILWPGLRAGLAIHRGSHPRFIARRAAAPVVARVGDFNLDGQLDIFKTHFAEDTNVLYRNRGKGRFEDVTIRSGIASAGV